MPADSSDVPTSLLESIDWAQISRLAAREVINRDRYAPVVSAYRWWARRPHSVMGALLDAVVDRFGKDLIVSDPFSGGGTVTFEAVRRGLRAYAQDLYPWPTYGLATTLEPVAASAFKGAAEQLQGQLAPLSQLYKRSDGRVISHILRIRQTHCAKCEAAYFHLPSPMLSLRSRSQSERNAFYCCAICGGVSERRKDCDKFRCSHCGQTQSATKPTSQCPKCHSAASERGPRIWADGWRPVLVSEVCSEPGRTRTILRPVEHGDPVSLRVTHVHRALQSRIPAGHETNRLVAAGFRRWCDLYSGRQLKVLLTAVQAVRTIPTSAAVKDRLALAILGAAEMPALLSRWDRLHLKPFEGLANHHYSCTAVAVESNMLSPVGRGTIARRLEAVQNALAWLRSSGSRPKVLARHTSTSGRRPNNWQVLIATGSSRRQVLRDRAVKVVLTDPPYHDDVQYGELSRLFHAWLRAYQPMRPIRESDEAVPNAYRGVRETRFGETIAACLRESNRTLQNDGVLLLTFHNREIAAWTALAGALHTAGFAVRAIAAVHAENRHDHCKRTVRAMLHDLVLECVKRTSSPTRARLAFLPRSAAEKNLAAVGLALADAVRTGHGDALQGNYRAYLAKFRGRKRLIA